MQILIYVPLTRVWNWFQRSKWQSKHKYKRITFNALKRVWSKLCILFSNWAFKIQWKSENSSEPKRDTIGKNTGNYKASYPDLCLCTDEKEEGAVATPRYLYCVDVVTKWVRGKGHCHLLGMQSASPRLHPDNHTPPWGWHTQHSTSESELGQPRNRELCWGPLDTAQQRRNDMAHSEPSDTAACFSFLLIV